MNVGGTELLILLGILVIIAGPVVVLALIVTRAKPAGPPPTSPPGWYPDPWQRHQLRWFSGGWSDQVADGDQRGTDPIS